MKTLLLIFSIELMILSHYLSAQVKLPALISDGMVLQREADLKIWGWASPGEEIEVTFLGQIYKTKTGGDGKWIIQMPELKPGGPYEMEITGSNQIKIKDILVGDVWVCSGQSQMDITMERVSPLYPEEIKNAGNPCIHYFAVPVSYNFNKPAEDFNGAKWIEIQNENIPGISAIAYFFADQLYSKYKIPVGLIRASHGGSPAEAWMSEDALKEFPHYYNELQQFKNQSLIDSIQNSDRERNDDWYSRLNQGDIGYNNSEIPWNNPGVNTSGWKEIIIPGDIPNDSSGTINGVFWFRKEIIIPDSLAEKSAKLNLGTLVDADSVFINGVYVGSTGYRYPPRRYKVPEGLLKQGSNTIVIRLISSSGPAGFVPGKAYELVFDNHKIDLSGKWKYNSGVRMEPLQGQTFFTWKPGALFNSMIAPLLNFPIKGVIWYQGESNTGRWAEYRKLFPAVISNWRNKWDQGDFPFLFVQLHNFGKKEESSEESYWALTREAQTSALDLPNTGMAVAIDLGEWNDLHPLNKKDVAKRLALAAYKIAYKEKNIVHSGPVFESMEVIGDSIVIEFSNIGSGLMVRNGGKLKHFSIAGENKEFVKAIAEIADDKVVVWSDKINKPVAVRYAWADNPEEANLYNKEGLPAVPFRTDKE